MQSNVEFELSQCLKMVRNWRESYERYFNENFDGDIGCWDFVIGDLVDDIYTHLVPYLDRVEKSGHITTAEMAEFTKQCFGEVKLLREYIKEAEDSVHQATYSYGEK